jgi:hypothetical protein
MAERTREYRRAERRAAIRRALAWTGRVGLAALAGLAVWGSLEVRARVESQARFDLSNWRLEIGELPAWAPEEMRAEIASLEFADEGERLTVFTPRVLDRVRRHLLACPWIRDVPRLRLRYPGGVSAFGGPGHHESGSVALDPEAASGEEAGAVADRRQVLRGTAGGIDLELDLRVPVALVAAGGACYLADRDGIRLGPALGLERSRALGLPVIAGGEKHGPRRPPPPGLAWEDRDVREGLSVARVLYESGIREQFPAITIDAIDVTNVAERARRGECEILLSAGPLRLGWGRSPISPGARTLSVPEILANLRQVLASPPRLLEGQVVLLYTSPLVLAGPARP